LQDTEKVSYLTRDGSFEGSVVLENSKNELSTIYHSTGNSQELRLKNVAETCYQLVEIFSDGSYVVIANWGCNGDSGNSSSQTPSTPTSPSGSGGRTGGTAPVPAIKLTSSFKDNSKVICAYDKLINTAVVGFNPLVITFLANFSSGVTINPGDITFNLGELNGGVYGNCVPYGSSYDKFYVTLNQNTISNRASIEIAGTLIHEILHAQIGHRMQTSSSSFISDFEEYITVVKGIGYTDQHQLMLENYLPAMIGFLKKYDGLNSFSADDKYYRGIALIGLKDLINFTQSEIEEMNNAQNYFRTRGLTCQ